ncbi:MAG: transposase [Verrucomicrobiota bacterium]
MARKLRIEFAGAVYHVMNRGDRREAIFHDDADPALFLETLAESCAKTGWEVQAFCLMPNHFHLVVETPQPNLVAGMKWLLGTYTARFNRRHKLSGHLFSGRYKALLVDGGNAGYLRTVCRYVHLNPVRAKLIGPEAPLREFRWSSLPLYLNAPGKRPAWLQVARVLGEEGIPKDSNAGRKEFERRMEERRQLDEPEEFGGIRRGWCLGDEAFRKELLAQMTEKVGQNHYGRERAESDLARAEQVLAAALAERGWTEEELKTRKKGDPVKVEIAARLRRETTMTLRWIAGRLTMGSLAYLNNRLYLARKRKENRRK